MTQDEFQSHKATQYRWLMVALLFAAIVINYVHRQTMGLLKTDLMGEFKLNEVGYANIVISFQIAYALGMATFGKVVDRFGAKLGYTVAFTVWTVAHTLTGLVTSVWQLAITRFTLGVGESGSFPSSIKAISDWFPQKERALAIGIFNAGTNIGAIVTPLVIPALVAAFSWRAGFIATGLVSFLWLIAWLKIYRHPSEHPKINAAEKALIAENAATESAPAVSWFKLLGKKETWAYGLAKFCTDPIWWFYLFWLPGFLQTKYGLDLKTFGPPLVAIYLISDIGSVTAGWVSSTLIKRGVSVNWARKLTLLGYSLLILPIWLVVGMSDLWGAVLLIGLATAGHQGFSANIMTVPSDLFPKAAVGSVIGIGGMIGGIGGIVFSTFIGKHLDATGNYDALFIIAGSAYLVAMTILHLISPKLKRVENL